MSPRRLPVAVTVATLTCITPQTALSHSIASAIGKPAGIGLFDSLNARFYLRETQTPGTADHRIAFGTANTGLIGLVGDWNGDGRLTPGIYDPATGRWQLRNSQAEGTPSYDFHYGPAGSGWQPIIGDWNGSGRDSVGLYDPQMSRFYLKDTLDGSTEQTLQFGSSNALADERTAVAGDWDGDGIDTIGLFSPQPRPRFQLRNENRGGIADLSVEFGGPGVPYIPITGDYNGDGRDSVGLYQPLTGTFLLRDTNTPGPADQVIRYGMADSGWQPLIGHFDAQPWLSFVSRYESGLFDEGAAEIVTYDAETQYGLVVNAASGQIDILDLGAPAAPLKVNTIDVSSIGASANSLDVHQGLVAVAVEAADKTQAGRVGFYDLTGSLLNSVEVGALPDALTFSPDGNLVVVANEGEPNDDYSVDPEGSVSIIDLSAGVNNATVRTATFTALNAQETALRAAGVRIFGPGATVAQDLEPEWVEVSADSSTAYVSLQENNAVAEVDLLNAQVSRVMPLGFKDWSEAGPWAGQGFDASNRDDRVNLQQWPVQGIFMPDTIRLFEADGKAYLVTANEGDARDYDSWTEEFRVADLQLDPAAFPDVEDLTAEDQLGRLRVTSTLGVSNGCDPSNLLTDIETECVYDTLFAYGGRSLSIFEVTDTGLELIYDTGSQMEQITARIYPGEPHNPAEPGAFNSNNDENDSFDSRSDDKGPEPEGLVLGTLGERRYAFVGLERIGGVMVFDITEPAHTQFVQYLNTRDFALSNTEAQLTTTDLGAEGLYFVPANESPLISGDPMLIVGNEVSGTTAVFKLNTIAP